MSYRLIPESPGWIFEDSAHALRHKNLIFVPVQAMFGNLAASECPHHSGDLWSPWPTSHHPTMEFWLVVPYKCTLCFDILPGLHWVYFCFSNVKNCGLIFKGLRRAPSTGLETSRRCSHPQWCKRPFLSVLVCENTPSVITIRPCFALNLCWAHKMEPSMFPFVFITLSEYDCTDGLK